MEASIINPSTGCVFIMRRSYKCGGVGIRHTFFFQALTGCIREQLMLRLGRALRKHLAPREPKANITPCIEKLVSRAIASSFAMDEGNYEDAFPPGFN
jgi:hypothetical protein